MKVKGWQIAVIVLGLLVGGWQLWRSIWGSNEVELADTIYLVDVETGELFKYRIASGRSLVLPARRESTGQIALIRIARDESGEWLVSGRDLGAMGALDKGIQPKAIDLETGRLLVKPGAPSSYSPPIPKR